MLDRLIGSIYVVPGATESQRERAALLVVAALMGIAISLVTSLAYLALGDTEQASAAAVGLGFCPIVLLALRLSGSIELTMNLTAITMSAAYTLSAFALKDITQLAWVGLVPVAVLLISNLSLALAWLVIDVGLVVGSYFLLMQAPERLVDIPAHILLVRAIIFVGAVFTLTLAFAIGRSRRQRSLEEARDEADRANALKSEFLANFSHEIRTPLNGVLGTADLLLSGPLTSEVRDQLLVIQRSGSSLLRTINDVLELSRIEAGRLDLFPVATDLPKLLGEVVDLFRARAQSKGLSLSVELEAGHPATVLVDDLRLRQVLQNLVGNAVKFTEHGFVRVRLTAGEHVDGLVKTRISVLDSGPGIAPEAVPRLFNAFTQARAEADRSSGSGLGLAISRQFVELMSGTLTVETAIGHGAAFHVTLRLPIAEVNAAAADAPPTAVQPAPAVRLRLLVADDNEVNLRVAQALLQRLGHEVLVARDGQQALAAVREHQPDVVFMDCQMPVLDGFEATRQLRSGGDQRPVIALTASVYAEDRLRCQEAGMSHFVSKPVTLASLKSALQEVAGALAPRPSPPAEPRTRSALVVDDDPHVRRMTVRLLRAEGFEVADAGDIESALILFERAPPDFVVVDHVLGGDEDGMHFAERLCHRKSGLQVVVTSGQPPTEDQLATLYAAGGRFLAKPYNRRALVDSMLAPPRR